MKIQIREKGRCFTIPIPAALVLNRPVLRLALKQSQLPPDAADRLLAELRRLSKGPAWELCRIESKNGECITIIIG